MTSPSLSLSSASTQPLRSTGALPTLVSSTQSGPPVGSLACTSLMRIGGVQSFAAFGVDA